MVSQVIKIEATLKSPEYDREDLAKILQLVQIQEKQKLHMVRMCVVHTALSNHKNKILPCEKKRLVRFTRIPI